MLSGAAAKYQGPQPKYQTFRRAPTTWDAISGGNRETAILDGKIRAPRRVSLARAPTSPTSSDVRQGRLGEHDDEGERDRSLLAHVSEHPLVHGAVTSSGWNKAKAKDNDCAYKVRLACSSVCGTHQLVSKKSVQNGRATKDSVLNDLLSKLHKHATENPTCVERAAQHARSRCTADGVRGQPGEANATIPSSSAPPPPEPPATAQARTDTFAFLGAGEKLRARQAAARARVRSADEALKALSARIAALEAQLEAAQSKRDEQRAVYMR